MNGSLKKGVKIGLIVAAIPLVIAGLLYYVLVHNLKDILKYAVEKQTKGGYTVNSKDIRLSLLDKTIRIDELVLTRKDTTNVLLYYNLTIPKAYLSIESWQELLVDKRVSIDSFSVEKPEVVIHDYKAPETSRRQTSFQTAMILENLQKALAHLHAKAFTIQHGSLTIYKRINPVPFRINDVTFTVRNFQKIDNNDKHVFGSDNVELALGRQRWQLSDGKNNLSFTGLRFSSATQLFEIDSILFQKPATAGQGETSLRADRFFFTSSHLPAVYQKGELILDTLICVRPILTLPLGANKNQSQDTTIHSNLKSLFNDVTIRYTQIKDGEILLAGHTRKASRAGTKKANLTIYNLVFNPRKQPSLSTDSLRLNLKNITFFSKDSLFKIAVESFTLLNHDVLFNQVAYGPVARQASGNQLTFTAPALRLRNISLEDLLRKRLVATDAQLVRPFIRIVATKKTPATTRPDTATVTRHTKIDMYQTLHGLAELLQVKTFRIIDASAQYTLAGYKPVTVDLKNMNATILLNKLLLSDSLVDIKHAMPRLTIGQVNAVANGMKLGLNQYTFDGKKRHNWLGKLRLDLANGTTLTGEKLYWEVFDWDVFQKTKAIQIDQLRMSTLTVDANVAGRPKATKFDSLSVKSTASANPKKPLPRLRIGQLHVGRIAMKATLPNQTLAGFGGEGIQVDKLTTDAHFFRWAQVSGKLNTLYFNQPGGKQITAETLVLNTQQNNTLTNLTYVDNQPDQTLQIRLPQLVLNGPFSSTDFSAVALSSVQVERPELTMVSEPQQRPAGRANVFSIPLNLILTKLHVNQALVNYTAQKGQDSTRIQTRVDMEVASLVAKKNEAVTVASVRVSPAGLTVGMPTLQTTVPSVNIQLLNGKLSVTPSGKPTLAAHVMADWEVAGLHPKLSAKKHKTPVDLRVNGITGNVDLPDFRWTAGTKIPWTTWVDHANVAIQGLNFKSTTTHLEAEKVVWTHKSSQLELDNFSIYPTKSKEDAMGPSQLQGDYIMVHGRKAQLSGIKTYRWYHDSTIAITHILLDHINTDVSRDKRLPDPAQLPNKPMPTRLLAGIKVPFRVDSISVINSQVNYHETSKLTNRVGTIPLKEINGTLKIITNRPNHAADSLTLLASTKLLGLHIKQLHYRESYGDSLSGFRMGLNTSDFHMTELTPITNPMATADLDDGYLEPMTARMAGNKYASVGNMRFFYSGLKLRLLGHADTTRKSILIRFENFIVGKVLRKKNQQMARIFYDRDQKKFIFGYWIKSIMSGVLVSVGVKGNKKYHANYLKLSQQHSLPIEE
ncbi:AsmA family protein [Spirosoma flavum]|uniref:DUF748 domain-containing protein n=1 Tax=Spirosoma flavum TaxID=2048557 RepID=A0ABW6ALY5_9BACT